MDLSLVRCFQMCHRYISWWTFSSFYHDNVVPGASNTVQNAGTLCLLHEAVEKFMTRAHKLWTSALFLLPTDMDLWTVAMFGSLEWCPMERMHVYWLYLCQKHRVSMEAVCRTPLEKVTIFSGYSGWWYTLWQRGLLCVGTASSMVAGLLSLSYLTFSLLKIENEHKCIGSLPSPDGSATFTITGSYAVVLCRMPFFCFVLSILALQWDNMTAMILLQVQAKLATRKVRAWF